MLAIAGGIVLAVVILYALGFILSLSFTAAAAIFKHLGTIIVYGLLTLVGLAAVFILTSLVRALGG